MTLPFKGVLALSPEKVHMGFELQLEDVVFLDAICLHWGADCVSKEWETGQWIIILKHSQTAQVLVKAILYGQCRVRGCVCLFLPYFQEWLYSLLDGQELPFYPMKSLYIVNNDENFSKWLNYGNKMTCLYSLVF